MSLTVQIADHLPVLLLLLLLLILLINMAKRVIKSKMMRKYKMILIQCFCDTFNWSSYLPAWFDSWFPCSEIRLQRYHEDIVIDLFPLSTELSGDVVSGLVGLVRSTVHVADSVDLIIDGFVDVEKALFWWHSLDYMQLVDYIDWLILFLRDLFPIIYTNLNSSPAWSIA